ncbi:MAG: TSUP family transporter [Brevinema sp.]
MEIILSILLIGLLGGILSGLFGIGGAVVIVPMLTMMVGMSQKMAQGTALVLFLISPSMIGAYQYYKNGNADIKTALILWVGVFVGAAIGAWIINTGLKDIPSAHIILKRAFSLIMVFFAVKMWIS